MSKQNTNTTQSVTRSRSKGGSKQSEEYVGTETDASVDASLNAKTKKYLQNDKSKKNKEQSTLDKHLKTSQNQMLDFLNTYRNIAK
jgi:hypothetical protein